MSAVKRQQIKLSKINRCICSSRRLDEETIARTFTSTNQSKGVILSTNQNQSTTRLFPRILQSACFCLKVSLVYDVICDCSDWFWEWYNWLIRAFTQNVTHKEQHSCNIVLTYFAISPPDTAWKNRLLPSARYTLKSSRQLPDYTSKTTGIIGSLDNLCPPWQAREITLVLLLLIDNSFSQKHPGEFCKHGTWTLR